MVFLKGYDDMVYCVNYYLFDHMFHELCNFHDCDDLISMSELS
jgi:hypothetical protein